MSSRCPSIGLNEQAYPSFELGEEGNWAAAQGGLHSLVSDSWTNKVSMRGGRGSVLRARVSLPPGYVTETEGRKIQKTCCWPSSCTRVGRDEGAASPRGCFRVG
jgi:hypothetical protein